MKVIIPVAGFGTRLRPHTLTKPKVLINVAGKPIIFHIVNQIINENISDSIVFVTGNMGEMLKEYLDSEFNFNFRFVKQENPLGLGHAVFHAKDYIKNGEDVLIILGDTMFDVNLRSICESNISAICVKEVEDPKRFGVAESDISGKINRFVEKPSGLDVSPSKDAIIGIYYIKESKRLFDSLSYVINNNIKTKNEFQLTDALSNMLHSGTEFIPYKVDNWLDCGKVETILQTNEYMLLKFGIKYNIDTCKIIGPAYIHKTSEITNSVIGRNVTINKGCKIHNSILENSIVDENCKIENAVIKDSLIGSHSNIIFKKKEYNISEYSQIFD